MYNISLELLFLPHKLLDRLPMDFVVEVEEVYIASDFLSLLYRPFGVLVVVSQVVIEILFGIFKQFPTHSNHL